MNQLNINLDVPDSFWDALSKALLKLAEKPQLAVMEGKLEEVRLAPGLVTDDSLDSALSDVYVEIDKLYNIVEDLKKRLSPACDEAIRRPCCHDEAAQAGG